MLRKYSALLSACLLTIVGCASGDSDALLSTESNRTCVAGDPKPVPKFLSDAYPSTRPTPTAKCDYTLEEFSRRLLRVMSVDKRHLNVDYIEKLFGIPSMTTTSDNPRYADFRSIESGRDGWNIVVVVTEGFFQAGDETRKFTNMPHPLALDSLQQARIRITFTGLKTPDGKFTCLKVDPFLNKAMSENWKSIFQTGTDGFSPGNLYQSPEGITLQIDFYDRASRCANDISLFKLPDS